MHCRLCAESRGEATFKCTAWACSCFEPLGPRQELVCVSGVGGIQSVRSVWGTCKKLWVQHALPGREDRAGMGFGHHRNA